MTVKQLIDELQKLNRPDDTVYILYDGDNAASEVEEVYITTEFERALAMLPVNVVTLRC